jgi:hypothetical protein
VLETNGLIARGGKRRIYRSTPIGHDVLAQLAGVVMT